MASNTVVHASRISRTKKIEKPRPLVVNVPTRTSMVETRLGTVEEIMALTDAVAANLANGNHDINLKYKIANLHPLLKAYGSKLEAIFKDQLDRSFVTFRNGSRDDALDYESRRHLLELIELRAKQWSTPDNSYYKRKMTHDIEPVTTPLLDNNMAQSPIYAQFSPVTLVGPMIQPQPLLLGPGELVKSSGKYVAPTRVIGKNYCKDEVVIRNSDSGKVMGIKGRRVHMIEELSETVISFQRVNPGAKERLVQITGPNEDKINYAKQLMEDTIRRNASPVRCEGDLERPESSSSVNTDMSDEGMGPLLAGRPNLLHSYSTNDASLGEYKYTVTVGDDSIKITGTNLDLVRTAKLVLDQYFSPDDEYAAGFVDEQNVFEHIDPYPLVSQDSAESEETYKDGAKDETKKSSPLMLSESPASKIRMYTVEEIIELADSPLSKRPPNDWETISREFFHIVRKMPFDCYTASALLALRPQEFECLQAKPETEVLTTID